MTQKEDQKGDTNTGTSPRPSYQARGKHWEETKANATTNADTAHFLEKGRVLRQDISRKAII